MVNVICNLNNSCNLERYFVGFVGWVGWSVIMGEFLEEVKLGMGFGKWVGFVEVCGF